MQSGNGDRAERLTDVKRRLDKDGKYWKHDGGPDPVDGTWVSNEAQHRGPDQDRKGKVIDRFDPELRHSYKYGWKTGKVFGGKRPSKRKAVK